MKTKDVTTKTISVRIERELYTELQQIKLDNHLVSITDAIKFMAGKK